jgi:hypothetical protein
MPNETAEKTAVPNEPAAPSTVSAWPADVPSPADAEAILCAAIGGLKATDDPPLDAALAALTALERDALNGLPTPVDGAPLRRGASIRYRLGAAIHGAPAAGSDVDGAALSTLLGEVDAALAEVAALAPSAPPPISAALEAIRNGLVKEAIDLSEIAQRTARAEPAAVPAIAPVAKAPAAATRMVSMTRDEGPAARRPIALWVAFAIVMAVAGGYHGLRWMRLQDAPPVPGGIPAPHGLRSKPGAPGGAVMLVPDGQPRDHAVVEAFKAEQRAIGREVRELPDGSLLIQRAPGAQR